MEIEALANWGFAALMCGYFMLEMNKTLKDLRGSIDNNAVILQRLCDKVEAQGKKIKGAA